MRIYLLPSVFIKRHEKEMIVINTDLHSVFIVNDIAADIIQLIHEKKIIDSEEIARSFESIDYEILNQFIQEMLESGIVGCSKSLKLNENNILKSDIKYDEDLEASFQLKFINDNKLYAAIIELTYRCNLRCSHCYAINNNSFNRELSTKQFFEILDQLYDNGVFRLTFTGGEIFVREDALDIIKYAYKKGFLIDIFSNATLLDELKIKVLAACYIRSFQVSLYSYKPEVHDFITGIDGSFKKTLKMVKLLRKYGIAVNIKSVMMEANSNDYKGLEKLAKDLDASFQTSIYLIPHNNGSKNNLNCRVKDLETVKKILSYDLKRVNAESFYKKRDKNDVICNMGRSGLSINPFGDIFPCNLLKVYIGNCVSEKISDIWNNSVKLQEIRKLNISDLKKCLYCKNLDYCFFCPGAALAETGNMLMPYSEACSIAEIKKSFD